MQDHGGHAHFATVTRGSEPDTVHFGSACVVDADGKVLWSLGDANARAFFRSSSKPLQALPVVTSGAAKTYGFTLEELALVCGSHDGGPEQERVVRSILAKCDLSENLLRCGEGVTDNCSGKHAGMLAVCKLSGYPLETYFDAGHPLQRRILSVIAEYCALDPAEVHLAGDGCSAPTFNLPLRNMAQGFARMGRESAADAESPSGVLFKAMLAHPGGHTGEPDVRPFSVGGGPPVTKGGANGLLCAALPGLSLGFALKVADGTAQVRWPVFIAALERAGLLSAGPAERMRDKLTPRVTSRRGVPTGQILVAF